MEDTVVYSARTSCAKIIGYVDLMVVEVDQTVQLRITDTVEVLSAIRSMPGNGPLLILLKVPVCADFHPQVLRSKYDEPALVERVRAFAVVTENRLFRQVIQLFLAFHSCPIRSAIFQAWPDACYWATEMQVEARPMVNCGKFGSC